MIQTQQWWRDGFQLSSICEPSLLREALAAVEIISGLRLSDRRISRNSEQRTTDFARAQIDLLSEKEPKIGRTTRLKSNGFVAKLPRLLCVAMREKDVESDSNVVREDLDRPQSRPVFVINLYFTL
jgi:hypothetical protein